jgi:heptosyltransferase-2
MKILIFCLPGIGDALMATPLIKLLKKNFPAAQIDIACMFSGVEYVFKNNPNVSQAYKLSLYQAHKFTGLKQILALRKNRYDVSVLVFPAYRREYHLMQFLAGAKKRVAQRFKKGYWSEFNFLDTDLVGVDEKLHNLENNLNLLQVFNIDWRLQLAKEEIRYDLALDQEDIIFGQDYIKKNAWENEEIVGLHPGSTDSPAALLRRWPIDRYAAVAHFLIKEKKNKILIFSGPDEKELGKDLVASIGDEKNCRLVEAKNFEQALGVLSQVKLLLCNDNGFGHLAVALGKKVLTLWASTNDRWSLPYDKNLVALIRPENFTPWYRYDLKRAIPKGMNGGMDKIEINQVISRINSL